MEEPLDETANISPAGVRSGKPLVITGTHHVQFHSDPNVAHSQIRAVQNQVYSPIHVLVAPLLTTIASYNASHQIAFSILTDELPAGLYIPQFQLWSNNTVLLRVAHSHGVGEGSIAAPIQLNLSSIFNPFPAREIVELSLTANQNKTAMNTLNWTVSDGPSPPQYPPVPGINNGLITIVPDEIRTFQLTFSSGIDKKLND